MVSALQQDDTYNEVSEVLDAIREEKDTKPTPPIKMLEVDPNTGKINLDDLQLKIYQKWESKNETYTKASRTVAARIIQVYCTVDYEECAQAVGRLRYRHPV